jgi:hypothetical protein
LTLSTLNYAQEKWYWNWKVLCVNFLNPAVELKFLSIYSTFPRLSNCYGGGYPDLTYGGNGFIYIISFADFQQKWFYNLNKRNENRNTVNNSGILYR